MSRPHDHGEAHTEERVEDAIENAIEDATADGVEATEVAEESAEESAEDVADTPVVEVEEPASTAGTVETADLADAAAQDQAATGDETEGPVEPDEADEPVEPVETEVVDQAGDAAPAPEPEPEPEPEPMAAPAASSSASAPTPPRRKLRFRTRPAQGPSWRRVARRSTAVASALVLVAGVSGLTWWGRSAPAPTPPPVEAMTITDKGARTTYVCPAQPANTLAVTERAETSARTVISPLGQSHSINYRGQNLALDGPTTLNAADGGVLAMEPAGDEAVSAATVVTTVTNSGDLRGLTAAPCIQPSAVSWIVGGSAGLGASADLRLHNPGVTTVTAKVTLYGSSGRLSLPSNGEITIPAGKSESLLLETSGGKDERIALSIEADGGSLVPTLVTESLDGETAAGVDVLTPGAAPATSQTIAGVQVVQAAQQGDVADESTGASSSEASVVRVVNPHDEAAFVSITLLGANGPTPLPGAQQVRIEPGSVFDLSLKGVEPGTYGVQVTGDKEVGAAVRLVRSAGEYPARSGALVHDEAWIQPTPTGSLTHAVLAVPRAEGFNSTVTLANSGPQRSLTLAAIGGSWRTQVSLPAGAVTAVEVPADVSALTLTTQSQEQSADTDGARGGDGAEDQAEGLAAATIVTVEASGDAAGTLISVVPAIADATVGAQRKILLG